jgi:MFS family permease
VSIMLMDRAGRRPLLALSSLGMAASGLSLAAFFVNGKRPAWLALSSLLAYIVSFSLGMGPVPWLFMGEIFPANVRAQACSLATVVNWSTSFAISYLFPVLQDVLQPQGCFALFAAFCAAAAVFALCVMPETKGKSFDAIAREFRAASAKTAADARSMSTDF